MICLFYQPTNPTTWILFGEKAIFEESYGPTLKLLLYIPDMAVLALPNWHTYRYV